MTPNAETLQREWLEKVQTAHIKGLTWRELEIELHDLCFNQFPELQEQYGTLLAQASNHFKQAQLRALAKEWHIVI